MNTVKSINLVVLPETHEVDAFYSVHRANEKQHQTCGFYLVTHKFEVVFVSAAGVYCIHRSNEKWHQPCGFLPKAGRLMLFTGFTLHPRI